MFKKSFLVCETSQVRVEERTAAKSTLLQATQAPFLTLHEVLLTNIMYSNNLVMLLQQLL
jgi:hypothetical protein